MGVILWFPQLYLEIGMNKAFITRKVSRQIISFPRRKGTLWGGLIWWGAIVLMKEGRGRELLREYKISHFPVAGSGTQP